MAVIWSNKQNNENGDPAWLFGLVLYSCTMAMVMQPYPSELPYLFVQGPPLYKACTPTLELENFVKKFQQNQHWIDIFVSAPQHSFLLNGIKQFVRKEVAHKLFLVPLMLPHLCCRSEYSAWFKSKFLRSYPQPLQQRWLLHSPAPDPWSRHGLHSPTPKQWSQLSLYPSPTFKWQHAPFLRHLNLCTRLFVHSHDRHHVFKTRGAPLTTAPYATRAVSQITHVARCCQRHGFLPLVRTYVHVTTVLHRHRRMLCLVFLLAPSTLWDFQRMPVAFTMSPFPFTNSAMPSACPRGKLEARVPGARTAQLSNFSRPRLYPSNVVAICVEGVPVLALVDTGAAVSVMTEKLNCHKLRKVTTLRFDFYI